MPRSKALNQQMRAQSQGQIIAAARRLFATQGYFSCKVTDIAREAGMSTGNVYWYYDGKEAILQAVLADGFETQERTLQEAAPHPGTAREKLGYLIEQYLALCQEHNQFFAILLSLLGHGDERRFQELGFDMSKIGARYHELLTSIIAQGQMEGTVIDLDPNVLAMFFFSLFNGMLLTYGDDWQTLPPETIQATVLRLLGAK